MHAPAAGQGSGRPRRHPPERPPVTGAARPRASLHIEFDGGARGNPSQGGAGSLLMFKRAQPDACTVLAQRAHFLGASGITN